MSSRIPKRDDYLIAASRVDAICDIGATGRDILERTAFKSQDTFNHRRGRRIAHILNDMFERQHFEGKRLIELGPGHYAFALLARHLGAEVVCIERDRAFVDLGRNLGFEVLDQDFNDLSAEQFAGSFDGLFAKGTFNACGPREDHELHEFVARITSVLAPSGWGWFTTVNKIGTAPIGTTIDAFVDHRVEIQRNAFVEAGWNAAEMMSEDDRPRYALKYANSRYLFSRNMAIPGAVPAIGRRGVEIALRTDASVVSPPMPSERRLDTDGAKGFNKVSQLSRPTFEYLENPWQYFVDFVGILKARNAHFVTMSDAYASRFDPDRINVILDHHIDYYPVETEVMCRWELENGVVSSVYLFNSHTYNSKLQRKPWTLQDLNIPFYTELERLGFEIGYHSNAVGQARAEAGDTTRRPKTVAPAILSRAQEFFVRDVAELEKHFNLRTFIPHGGGEGNVLLTDIPSDCADLIWAYNGRKGTESGGPDWKNFSDSNAFHGQRMNGAGATYIARVDNLHLFAHLAEPGLNHVLIHSGRYSRGMPYDLYGGPTPLVDQFVEKEPFVFERPVEQPLRARQFMRGWNTEPATEMPSRKYYVFCDNETTIAAHMAASDSVIPVLIRHRRITKDEKLAFKVPRESETGVFTLPEHGKPFEETFRQFFNLAFMPNVFSHLANSDVPLDRVIIDHAQSTNMRDARLLKRIADRVPPDGGIRLTTRVPSELCKSWMAQAGKSVADRNGTVYSESDLIVVAIGEPV